MDGDDAGGGCMARGVSERGAAAIGAQRRAEAALPELQAIVEKLAASAGSSWTEIIGYDLAFHQTLVEAAGSARLTRMFRTLIAETRLCLIRLEPVYQEASEVVAEHRAIPDALRSGEA